ncbi:MAG: hypothetical protein GZ094_24395 [Mariniphaga sp.]|nr:hypothetical protein [Mariniphaga sp.]
MKNLFGFLFALFIGATFLISCKKSEGTTVVTNDPPKINENYVTGDFHQHTTYTDGSWSIGYVMAKNNSYKLDFWANSEHGGGFTRNAAVSGLDLNGASVLWSSYTPNPAKGKANSGNMWRWQSIAEYSYLEILKARALYPTKTVIQGMEWNVPGHEHASTAIITNQFIANSNANPVAEFEYKFDGNDADDQGGANNWIKSVQTGHAKTIEAITWMQTNYKTAGWIIPAHPERKKLYTIADFRDMNNAGPDVCFGFESMPGHQKSPERGEYKASSNSYGTCTYGGTGAMAAKVGGLWDAMLSEGRSWWLFANSDFHDITGDFYPGEFQKNYVYVTKKGDAQAITDGLRSGNVFVVTGDLIDALDFTIKGKTIGQTATITGNSASISILVHDPSTPNNNTYGILTNPELNHIDVIAGKVTGKIAPTDSKYSVDDVTSTTNVIARFDAVGSISDTKGIVSRRWEDLGNGWKKINFDYSEITGNMYFRLRGSNIGLNVASQTDGSGNPLADDLMAPNTAEKTFADLWFYSNPIFVNK